MADLQQDLLLPHHIYTATFNEREMWTLGEALSHYQTYCKKARHARIAAMIEGIRNTRFRVVGRQSAYVTLDPRSRAHLPRRSTYTALFEDVEEFAITEALRHYRGVCEKKLAKKPDSPSWARDRDINSVRRKFRLA